MLFLAIKATFAATACGLSAQDDRDFPLTRVDACVFDIKNHTNYANLNQFIIFDSPVDNLPSNDSIAINENGKPYFVLDEVDEAKFTQKTIRNYPATSIKIEGLRGYIGNLVGLARSPRPSVRCCGS